MIYDLVIVGAGASGLAAAYKGISLNPKLHILVLEKEALPGRKMSAAGNGKCNLTNSDFGEESYHSENRDFIRNWTRQHSFWEVLDFFEELGVILYQNNGYFYPVSNQGKQVTNLLVEKSRQMGVTFLFETRVSKIELEEAGGKRCYHVKTVGKNEAERSVQTRNLILAAGGMAASKLGGCRDGYQLGRQLKLKQYACYPVLSPVYVEDKALSLARGVRLDAAVTLKTDEGYVRESGQVQFNEKSISGIVIMNLSYYVNRQRERDWREALWIDTLPALSWEKLKELFIFQRKQFPKASFALILSGILPNAFVKYILKRLQLEPSVAMENLTEKQMNRISSALKKLTFTPVFYEDYDKAQVTGGGIAMEEVESSSFECKRYRNLYITGEVLDVNGKCGGYNLTFAVLSGIQAAEHAVRQLY